MAQPKIQVVEGSIDEAAVDVIALKYAQAPYGADKLIAALLAEAGEEPAYLKPRPGGYRYLPGRGAVSARHVLLVGVVMLQQFGYKQIREFAKKVLTALAGEAPSIRSLAVTLHGPGYGLDETEAFEAEIAGFLDAIREGDCPGDLQEILVVERNRGRCARLGRALRELFIEVDEIDTSSTAGAERLGSVGYESENKAHVFVAMPFREDMDDLYHYGIQQAVKDAGFLCERADLATFTGDVLRWVQERIRSCALLVADLSEANPNVYLEVGFAWGCGVPAVLLVRDTDCLRFDVRGQRCLTYRNIRDLEESLRRELRNLAGGGGVAGRA